MRFKRQMRHPFTDTERKRAALRRKQRKEREALPLLAPLVAAAQPGEDDVMRARAEAWAKQEAKDRADRARAWRKARRRLADLPRRERTILRKAWNGAPYPATPVYLLDFLHRYLVGVFSLDDLPFDPSIPTDAHGRRIT
jgi:hypothetical protein